MNPADITALLIHLEVQRRQEGLGSKLRRSRPDAGASGDMDTITVVAADEVDLGVEQAVAA